MASLLPIDHGTVILAGLGGSQRRIRVRKKIYIALVLIVTHGCTILKANLGTVVGMPAGIVMCAGMLGIKFTRMMIGITHIRSKRQVPCSTPL